MSTGAILLQIERIQPVSDPMKKVQSGNVLVIPAQARNTFIDVAKDFQQRTLPSRSGS